MGLKLPAPDDQDALWELIFEPGFSTSAGITYLSGTGVGMDGVRRYIAALDGDIRIESKPGQGRCFTLEFSAE